MCYNCIIIFFSKLNFFKGGIIIPRVPRNLIRTSFFHIITQGIDKSYIFNNSEDIKFYIKSMYLLSKDFPINIIAYCIMNNHAHILINTQYVDVLSKYMQRLNTKYGKYYNDKYQRVGYVFRDRYKSEGIFSEKHLYSCIRYIYNNPVKAGICTHAKDYPYSNYHDVKGNLSEDFSFIDVDEDVDHEILYKNLIEEFLLKNNIKLIDLKDNDEMTEKLIVWLKDCNNISLRKIANELNLNREKVRKIYANSK